MLRFICLLEVTIDLLIFGESLSLMGILIWVTLLLMLL